MNDSTTTATGEAPAPIPHLIDAKAAAIALGIGARKLWALTDCGELASIRIGNRVRYDPRDLEDFIARNRRERRG